MELRTSVESVGVHANINQVSRCVNKVKEVEKKDRTPIFYVLLQPAPAGRWHQMWVGFSRSEGGNALDSASRKTGPDEENRFRTSLWKKKNQRGWVTFGGGGNGGTEQV